MTSGTLVQRLALRQVRRYVTLYRDRIDACEANLEALKFKCVESRF